MLLKYLLQFRLQLFQLPLTEDTMLARYGVGFSQEMIAVYL